MAYLSFYQKLYWAYMALALLLFTFLVPPFQKNDEPAHYFRSVSLTNLDLACKQAANGRYYSEMKRKYADFPAAMNTFFVAFRYEAKFDTAWLRTDFSDPKFDENVRVLSICNQPIPGYLPNVAGIWIGKPFESPLIGFYLGRLFGAIFFVGAIILALRIVPGRYSLLVYFYAALPTVLHQVSAISYDAVHLSLFPLVFAYMTKFVVEAGPIRPRDWLIFCGLLWWTVSIKSLAYYPFLLFYFVVPYQKVSPTLKDYVQVTGAFFLVTAVTSVALEMAYLERSGLLDPARAGIDAPEQVKGIAAAPWDFAAVVYRTMLIYGERYLKQAIGVFGWIDYEINFLTFYVFAAIGGVLAFRAAEREESVIDGRQIALLWAGILLTIAFLFVSLYAVWSPVDSELVYGVQGRYFVGLIPFAVFAIAQTATWMGKGELLKLLALILGIVLVISILKAVTDRYY